MKTKKDAKKVLKQIQKNMRCFSVKRVYKIHNVEILGWEIIIRLKSNIIGSSMMKRIFQNIEPTGYVHIAEDGKLEICIS